MNYQDYTLEDFLADESFVNYCLALNKNDIQLWESLLNTHPLLIDNVKEAKLALNEMQQQLANNDAKQSTEAFRRHFYTTYSKENRYKNIIAPTSFSLFKVISAAAAIIVMFLGLYTLYGYNKQEQQLSTAKVEAKEFQPLVYNTSLMQRYTVTLPDGSTVLLNYNSTIRTDTNYNNTDRKVYLQGEAFFDVKKDATKPFIVLTKNNATTAIGTSFTVRQYSYEKFSSVALVTGKVNVVNNKKAVLVLNPGEKAIQKSNTLNKILFNVKDVDAWKKNKLEFRNTTIKNVFATLEAHYGIVFNYNTSLANKHFTGSFENKSLQHILEVVSLLNQVAFKITAKEVLIYKK